MTLEADLKENIITNLPVLLQQLHTEISLLERHLAHA